MHEVDLNSNIHSLQKKKIVKSDAWPTEELVQNEAKSLVHDFLRDHCDQINIEHVYYRRLT